MFRRGRYSRLAQEDDLEFVGTSAEYLSPHHRRYPYRVPSYNPAERQLAGRDATSGAVTPVASLVATDNELTNVIGILYFLSWTRKALKNYSNDIRKLYEIPLTERCYGKMEDNSTIEETIETSNSRNAAKEAAKKLEKGFQVAEQFTDLALIKKRIADSIANPALDRLENHAETPRQLVTPIEIACLSRLRTLVKMSGSWLKKTVDMETWMEKNRKTLVEHGKEVSKGIEFAVTAFNAACILGEIYGLEPVDRKAVKKDFASMLEAYERPRLDQYGKCLTIDKNAKAIDYVGLLEARLNYHRSLIHIIGSSTISLFQIILKALPTDLMETTTRSLREIGNKLPPSFRFYDDLKLSPFASKFLSLPPPNSIEFPYGELELPPSTTTETLASRISSKVQSQSRNTSGHEKSALKSEKTQSYKSSMRSPEGVTLKSNSTQRSASSKSPPTARNGIFNV